MFNFEFLTLFYIFKFYTYFEVISYVVYVNICLIKRKLKINMAVVHYSNPTYGGKKELTITKIISIFIYYEKKVVYYY